MLSTQETGPIYPQMIFKAGPKVPGTVYIDEVQIIKAIPALMETRYKNWLGYPYEVSILCLHWRWVGIRLKLMVVPS